ncbi:hypothetical protein BC830DRAFT_698906 [Chytriomyces sp. MP71]|nr:hypothetical protein BC830DRAFT_698906 [Chytriomyces sp. MP71]
MQCLVPFFHASARLEAPDAAKRVDTHEPLRLQTSRTRFHGQHLSRGFAALAHAKGPHGTFRAISTLSYECNYYKKWATPAHPYSLEAVLDAASHPPHITTCRDADGILLADFDGDGEIDVVQIKDAKVFVEHWGLQEDGSLGTPFSQAWFDDNWVARIAMQAYCDEEPWGLHDSWHDSADGALFPRFVVIDGGAKDPYPEAVEDPAQYPDQISLHALYLANREDWKCVQKCFDALLVKSGATFLSSEMRWSYPAIRDFYHLCDMKLVGQRLLDSGFLNERAASDTLQHVVSLHSLFYPSNSVTP